MKATLTSPEKILSFIDNELSHTLMHVTKNVRNVSKKTFTNIQNKSIDFILEVCEFLLEKRSWTYSLIAYDFAYRVKKQYSIDTFHIFEKWLFTYIENWGDCDDFCTHAFGTLLSMYNELFMHITEWTTHHKFSVRRASAVILIHPIKYNCDKHIDPFLIADKLLNDPHYLVQKGYGWMLKVLSKKKQSAVVDYLKKNHEIMPRTAFRYALENMDKNTKNTLMKL